MHPADVAEYVAASVDVLREKLRALPDLNADDPVLEDGVKLYIPFVKIEREIIQHGVASGLLGPQGQAAVGLYQVPDLGAPPVRKKMILHMDLTDFDGQPPTAELLLGDRSPLPAHQWPRALGNEGIIHGHQDYDRPFFCRRGLREYHSHPQHEDNPWDRHRENLPLHGVVLELLTDLRYRWFGK